MNARLSSGVKLGVAHELGLAGACTAALLIVLVGGELPAFAWRYASDDLSAVFQTLLGVK